jgi:rhodanese-related sulfurtransferase
LETSCAAVADALGADTLPFQLVDVREEFELSRGVLPGARWLPMSSITARVEELDRSRPVVCYCEHGVRSYDVAAWLQQRGFQAKSMAGGFAEWQGPVANWTG